MTVLCAPMFLVLLDVLAMNVAMPVLGRTFGVAPASWSAVVDAYTVPLALILLPAGWLVDRFGPRRCLVVSLVAFAAASSVGGLAWSWVVVLTARAAQGASAAVMLPAGLAALTLAWPDEAERAQALGTWAAVSAIATAIGPGIGGVLVQVSSWRLVFGVNVPVALVAVFGVLRWVDDRRSPRQAESVRRRRALVASVLAAAVMTSGANGALQVVTMHLQAGEHLSPGLAGVVLLAATLPFAVLGPVSGRLMARHGRRCTAAAGFVFGALGVLTLGHFSPAVGVVPGLLGIGVGLGLMTAAIVGESLGAWPARPGVASGLNNALRQVGTSVGVAVGGTLASHEAGGVALTHTGWIVAGWWLVGAAVVWMGFEAQGSHP